MGDYAKQILGLVTPYTRAGLQFLTGAWILALSLVFAAAFVSPVPMVRAAMAQMQLPEWVYGSIIVLAAQAIVVLMGTDTLASGDPRTNGFAAAFQANWPSRHLAARLHVEQEVAAAKWFDEINCWSNPDHIRNEQWQRMNRRGYSCRFVYYLQSVAFWLLWASASWMALEWVAGRAFGFGVAAPEAKTVAIGVFALVGFSIRLTNRIGEQGLSGVWKRERSLNRELCVWIDENLDRFREPAALVEDDE